MSSSCLASGSKGFTNSRGAIWTFPEDRSHSVGWLSLRQDRQSSWRAPVPGVLGRGDSSTHAGIWCLHPSQSFKLCREPHTPGLRAETWLLHDKAIKSQVFPLLDLKPPKNSREFCAELASEKLSHRQARAEGLGEVLFYCRCSAEGSRWPGPGVLG